MLQKMLGGGPTLQLAEFMVERIQPARAIRGVISVGGDKSISHRYALLAAMADGGSEIYNFSSGADPRSTLECLAKLGVAYRFAEEEGRRVLRVEGVGLRGLRKASETLDAGNSGSTIRMLSGLLAGHPFQSSITGDESLVKRPMRRIIEPLELMGARVEATNERFPPLTIDGTHLRAIRYRPPVPSAQVKSCVLLAGLLASGETVVEESITTRDHTEIAMRELGADIDIAPRLTRLRGGTALKAKRLLVPGDLSSAAFFLVAAAMAQEADLTITDVGLNPTRTALLDVLRAMGVDLRVTHIEHANGEPIGALRVLSSSIQGGVIQGGITAAVIDEIPVLAALGAISRDGLTVLDAGELRVKETDRIATIADNLTRMGVSVEITPTSLRVPGGQTLEGAGLNSFGDHRIAMAFAIAALAGRGPSTIDNAEAASVSFPNFFQLLSSVVN